MNEMIPALLFVSDSRKALLYKGALLSGQADGLPRARLELAERLESPWTDFHEHGRPSALGRGPSANAAQHFAGEGHEPEELERRFAAQVAAWIAERTRSSPEAAAAAFADPRFLGHLRGALATAKVEVEVHRGDYSWMRPAELGAHPGVRSALDAARARLATMR